VHSREGEIVALGKVWQSGINRTINDSDVTILNWEENIFCGMVSSNMTITLPNYPVPGQWHRFVIVTNTGGDDLIVHGNTRNVNGAASKTFTNPAQYNRYECHHDDKTDAWFIFPLT
jgi:hypothetical protein